MTKASGMRAARVLLVAVVAVCFLGLSGKAFAADEIIRELTVDKLVEIMKKEGYAVTHNSTNVSWKLKSYECLLLIYDDGKAIQFYVGFDVKTSLTALNEWNKTKRFSRTYLDDDGDPSLELDLDLTGGVTLARLHDFFRTCEVSLEKWNNWYI